jgi:uncharacterized protein (TIGR03790 family)
MHDFYGMTGHSLVRPRGAHLALAALALGLMLAQGNAAAAPDVVVVYNRNLRESQQVAEYYAQRRQVPPAQVIGLDLPTGETMSRQEYNETLRDPLAQALVARGLFTVAPGEAGARRLPVGASLRHAALCYGVPLKIRADGTLNEPGTEKMSSEVRRNDAAVDSELACLPMSFTNYRLASVVSNPFYGATNAARLHPTNGVLLVARLDGPTPEIARGLVDKAMAAETNGLWGRAYFDLRNAARTPYEMGDRWLAAGARACTRAGYDILTDTNEATFRASYPLSHIAVYAGWYDGEVSGPFTRAKVEFMPGAFAYHLHSFSAQSIRTVKAHWVGPLLAKGATITMGCVEEPYLVGTPNIGTFLECLLERGFTFGEAACASQANLSWQITVVGDPLYRPTARRLEDLHADLMRRKNPLVEWSHLKQVNLDQAKGLPFPQLVADLKAIPATRVSAVLLEKLAELYWATNQYSDAQNTLQAALRRNPSPQQKVRLHSTLNERWRSLERADRQFANLETFARDCPDYPDLPQLHRQLAELAEKLGRKAAAEKYRQLAPP